jgi:hypothetical protein
MKINIILSILAACILMACEHNVSTGTIVYEDGSLDRIVVFQSEKTKPDTVEEVAFFDVDSSKGWTKDEVLIPSNSPKVQSDTGDHRDTIRTEYADRFVKHFASVEAVNRAMNTDSAVLYIESRFEKKFRWFYTYIVYSDTYKSVNQYKRVPLSDYFAKEDYEFIQRLPSESAKISKADSLYLDQLDKKLSDQYLERAYFEELYVILEGILQRRESDKHFADTLRYRKEKLFYRLKDDATDNSDMIAALDSIGISLSAAERSEYNRFAKQHEYQLARFFAAASGKYVHHIQMPWPVVASNADSVVGNSLFWKPPVVKFLVTDYTMQAESRQLNYWAVIASGVFIVAAGVLVFRPRRLA